MHDVVSGIYAVLFYFNPEPLNLMFCDESEYSLAAVDSGDENVMEGGLTIRQHQQHQQGCSSARLPRVSSFEFLCKEQCCCIESTAQLRGLVE